MAVIEFKSTFSNAAPARSQDWSALPRRLGYVFWILAAFIACVAMLMAYSQHKKMSTWLPVQATLVQRDVYWDYSRNTKGGSSVVYGARFTFQYELEGKKTLTVADLGYRSSIRSWIAHETELLPVGTKREIRVNPDSPNEASLASDYGRLSFAAAYFAATLSGTFFAMGFILWWWGVQCHETRERKLLAVGAG